MKGKIYSLPTYTYISVSYTHLDVYKRQVKGYIYFPIQTVFYQQLCPEQRFLCYAVCKLVFHVFLQPFVGIYGSAVSLIILSPFVITSLCAVY